MTTITKEEYEEWEAVVNGAMMIFQTHGFLTDEGKEVLNRVGTKIGKIIEEAIKESD